MRKKNIRLKQREVAQRKINAEQTVEAVFKLVALHRKIDGDWQSSKSRKREIVLARQMASTLVRDIDPTITFSQIGAYTGQHHATVMHGIEVFQNHMANDKSIENEYENIKNLSKFEYRAKDTETGEISRFYTVNLNNCISVRVSDKKSVVLIGYTMEEAKMIGAVGSEGESPVKPVKHTNTGLVLMERVKD